MENRTEQLKKYSSIDEVVTDGCYTIHSDVHYNMKDLLDYCKKNKINYKDLTDDQLKQFQV